MTFKATKAKVYNRGVAPDSFLTELVAWAKQSPDAIFAPNDEPVEIYTVIKSSLATTVNKNDAGFHYSWDSLLQRKAALLEAMHVHAGLESSWNWNEGIDVTNKASMRNKRGQETGIFQVSYDSLDLHNGYMKPIAVAYGIEDVDSFISKMKRDHDLALTYYANLVRVSIAWAGPLLRSGKDSIYPWLNRDSMNEFMELLS